MMENKDIDFLNVLVMFVIALLMFNFSYTFFNDEQFLKSLIFSFGTIFFMIGTIIFGLKYLSNKNEKTKGRGEGE